MAFVESLEETKPKKVHVTWGQTGLKQKGRLPITGSATDVPRLIDVLCDVHIVQAIAKRGLGQACGQGTRKAVENDVGLAIASSRRPYRRPAALPA